MVMKMKTPRFNTLSLFAIAAIITVFMISSAVKAQDSVGIVTALQGVVNVSDSSGIKQLSQGDNIFMGDIIETGEDSGVKIVFNDESMISLGDNTVFEINEFVYTPTQRKAISNITKGKMRAIIKNLKGGNSDVEFNTPNAVAGIKGTTLYINADKALFCVREGEVEVGGNGPNSNTVTLGSNQFTQIVDGEPISPEEISNETWLKFKKETNIFEGFSDTTSALREEYPGKEGSEASSPVALSESIADFPSIPPIDLTPGAGVENVVNIDVIIDIN